MATTSLLVSTVETNPRVRRALDLYRERGEEIERISRDLFLVPSGSEEGRYYHVTYGVEETCDCPDHQYRHVNCAHIYAVGIALAKRRSRPHACQGGLVFLGGVDEETGEEIVEVVPCRRCAGEL